MQTGNLPRFVVIGALLLLSVFWSFAFIPEGVGAPSYPNGQYLATPDWLNDHKDDRNLVIVDVRTNEHFDGKVIPGAVRMPWSLFRIDDPFRNLASGFIGTTRAQEILGEHGLGRADTVVLYDSVQRDGGATASYLFWVLDILGHEQMRILEGGIDAWSRDGFVLDSKPDSLSPILYQAPSEKIRTDRLIDGGYVYKNLGDPFHQIIDVRSEAEYLGEKGTKGLKGNPLKLGHIPTAVNVNYKSAWTEKKTKEIKTYPELQALYKGLDPGRNVILYCNSGRRSSFSYYILRLMGIDNVVTYEHSWKEWGVPQNFYPVETTPRKFSGDALPGTTKVAAGGTSQATSAEADSGDAATTSTGGAPKGGYVSCGG